MQRQQPTNTVLNQRLARNKKIQRAGLAHWTMAPSFELAVGPATFLLTQGCQDVFVPQSSVQSASIIITGVKLRGKCNYKENVSKAGV